MREVLHSTLVAIGVRWLSRKCSVVLSEFATPADETPDVIGCLETRVKDLYSYFSTVFATLPRSPEPKPTERPLS